MTTQEKLQAITRAIQEVCPDLMELTEGCRLLVDDCYGEKNIEVIFGHEKQEDRISKDNKKLFRRVCADGDYGTWDEEFVIVETIGKPITLSHILRWLDTIEYHTFIFKHGYIYELVGDDFCSEKEYNLKQDTLEQQSPDFINFLYSLLPAV